MAPAPRSAATPVAAPSRKDCSRPSRGAVMRTPFHAQAQTGALVLSLFCAGLSHAQAVRPATETRDPVGPFQMEIYSGPNRTVHYFTGSLSPTEALTLSDYERAENDLAYLNDLQALRRQYVNDERYLETVRRVVQDRL